MVYFLSLLSFLFIGMAVSAQNWSPINTEETFYFNTGAEELTGVGVDSMAVIDGVVVWYTNRMVDYYEIEEPDPNSCYTPSIEGTIEAPFLQGEIVQTETGQFIFQYPDTFLIDPQAGVGEGWVFSEWAGQDPVTAQVVFAAESEFLGVIDSVKTIDLSDGRTLALSKNHGLLSFESADGVNYSLSGIPERQLGEYPISRFEIFDFATGDVFVFLSNASATSNGYYLGLHRFEIMEVVDDGNGNIELTYSASKFSRGWVLSDNFFLEEVEPSSTQGTFTAEISLNGPHLGDVVLRTFYSSPVEADMNMLWIDNVLGNSFGNHKVVYSDNVNSRESKVIGGSAAFSPQLVAIAENITDVQGATASYQDVFFQEFDLVQTGANNTAEIGDTTNVFFSTMDCGTTTFSTAYADGLGAISSAFYTGLNFEMTAMVGYRKGAEEFGYVPSQDDVIVMSTEDISALPSISVYPVPATDRLNISDHEAHSFRIFDVSGKLVLQNSLRGANVIDVSALGAGIYQGQTFKNGKGVGQFRFVKQ